jgi:hypothetical protein
MGDEPQACVTEDADGFRARELAWAILQDGIPPMWGRTLFFDDLSGGLPPVQCENVNVTYMWSVSHLPLNPAPGLFAGERACPSRELGAELRRVYGAAMARGPVQIQHCGRTQGARVIMLLSHALRAAAVPDSDRNSVCVSDSVSVRLCAAAAPPLNAAPPVGRCCRFHQSGRGRCPSVEVLRRLGPGHNGAYRSPSDRSVGL